MINHQILDAAWYARHEDIRILLEKGAKVNIKDINNGKTALHLICDSPNRNPKARFECLRMLIDNGADCNSVDNSGRIPLHYICRTRGILEWIKLLTVSGSHLDKKDFLGNTPSDLHSINCDGPIYEYAECIRNEINFIKKATYEYIERKKLLLLARTFDRNSLFYKDLFPLDLFKIIFFLVCGKNKTLKE